MPQPKKGPRLASSPAHERLMLANMATSLFKYEQITTTLPRAKRLQPLADRLITFAKGGSLADRRRVMRLIRDKSVVHKLFTSIADRMEGREGGYTRIIKISPRTGDNSPMAIISLVTTESPKNASLKEAETAVRLAEDALMWEDLINKKVTGKKRNEVKKLIADLCNPDPKNRLKDFKLIEERLNSIGKNGIDKKTKRE